MSIRTAFAALLSLLATSLLTFSAAEPARAAPEEDKLYARFSELVLSEFAAKGFNCAPASVSTMFGSIADWQTTENPLVRLLVADARPREMDFTPVLSWEPEFRDDPRYWQLRLACGLDEVHSDNPEGPYHSDFLDRMLAGCADEGSWERLPLREMVRYDEEQGNRLLSEAVTRYGDNCFWQYQLAFNYLEYGEVDHAWSALKAGNALPLGHVPQAYPYSTLFDPAYAPHSDDEVLVRGVIATMSYDNYLNYIRIKENFKIGQLYLAMGFDPAFADDLQICGARLGQLDNLVLLDQSASAALCSMMPNYAARELLPAPLDADPVLLELGGSFKRLTGEFGPGDNLGQFGTAFDGPGTADTPFREAYYRAAPDIQLNGIGGRSFDVELPPLGRQDWINFAASFDAEQQQVQAQRQLFAALPAPPFARLFAEAEAAEQSSTDSDRSAP